MIRRLLKALAPIAVCFDLCVIIYAIYLAYWPMTALTVQPPDKILSANKQVHQGDALVYEIYYCKYTTKQATVNKLLIGKINYPLSASTNNVPTGCKTAITRNTIIPDGIEPGKYRLELTASYQVNPLRVIEVRHDSEEFEVLPKQSQVTTIQNNVCTSSVTPSASSSAQTVTSTITTTQAAPTKLAEPSQTHQPAPTSQSTPMPQPSPPPSQPGPVESIIKLINGLL